jgi:RNA polymerase sigma-70 factor (ECF subfamily)
MREERDQRWSTWMVAAQNGDSASYEKLLRELLPHVRRHVQWRIFNASAVDDVVQNVFVSLHRARATYRPERPFLPWINAVTRNAVVDAIRESARRGQREISLEADGVPEPAIEAAEPHVDALSAELEGALEQLPAAQRQAVLMIHVEGLSIAEASARVGVSKSALKVRAHRGYRALRRLLEEVEA